MTAGARWRRDLIRFVVVAMLLATGSLATTTAPVHYELEIGDERFFLEIAADPQSRSLGLGGRRSIDARGGMIFVFPTAKVRDFFMRDCVMPIDIIFLGKTGVITATHTMLPEAPKSHAESNAAYERRLKRYPSRSASQYAIELRAGTIKRLGLKPEARVMLDTRRLQNALR